MRTPSLYRGLLILPFCMFGCSQNWAVRTPPGDDVKTVASVGDNALPIRSGTYDSSVPRSGYRADLAHAQSRANLRPGL